MLGFFPSLLQEMKELSEGQGNDKFKNIAYKEVGPISSADFNPASVHLWLNSILRYAHLSVVLILN